MDIITYKLLNGTEENPVKVVVDANSAFATISWTYMVTFEQESCNTYTIKNNSHQTVQIEPWTSCTENNIIKNSLKWEGETIYYEITQKKTVCSCNDSGSTTYELVKSWISPYKVYSNRQSNNPQLFYEYNEITKKCGEIINYSTVRKQMPIDIDYGDITGSSEVIITGITPTTEEGFEIKYSLKYFYNSSCTCDDFDFDENVCGCDKFSFLDENCNCDDFKFADEDCSCDDFEFNDKK